MKTRAEIAAARRQRLLAESAARRAALASQAQSFSHSVESANIVLRITRRFGQHPEWIAVTVIGFLLVTPRRLSLLLQASTSGLRTWRMIAPTAQALFDFPGIHKGWTQ